MNVGTCITALLSALSAGKNGKRSALVQLYFNMIGALIFLGGYFALDAIIGFTFTESSIDMWGIALIHTIFNLVSVLVLAPFRGLIEKLAVISVKGDTEEADPYPAMLDERFLDTPELAVERAHAVAHHMMELAVRASRSGIAQLTAFNEAEAESIRKIEDVIDDYEDKLGAYLIALSSRDLVEEQSGEVTKLLHLIGDFERISDHAVNLLEAAEEMREKNVTFSEEAQKELAVLYAAVSEILSIAETAYLQNDRHAATHVEPLEEVVDDLKDTVRSHHIRRLQTGKCTTEHGFILSDILTNLERVSDHCSNVAVCLLEIADHDTIGMHGYAERLKAGSKEFDEHYREYQNTYRIPETEAKA
jgi:phosphate:Na+ symporter